MWDILTLSNRLVFACVRGADSHFFVKHLFPLSAPNFSFACHLLSLQSSPRQTERGWTPLLDPLSLLRFVQSDVMENVILRKSFTVTAWTELIKRASSDGTVDEDAVLALSQIILELKFKEPVRLLKPFLHKISPHLSCASA